MLASLLFIKYLDIKILLRRQNMSPIVSTTWDPQQYARFADERGRPFRDLLARVLSEHPRVVMDLGCGDGPLTMSLAERWPEARVVGVDSSPQMLTRARRLDDAGRVDWVQADLTDWDPESLGGPADVIVTNATLQWVPEQMRLIERWVGALSAGGWFAMQVPGNRNAPSHALMREVAAEHPRRRELESALARPGNAEPSTYLTLLSRLGCDVDAWETTYLHVLDPSGRLESPVLEWVRGTGLRPVLDVLTDPGEQAQFVEEYDRRLRAAYPRTAAGVVLPFRRVFAVAHMRTTTEAG
jgi:trans-aconitate 2-methyltransferase